jgi:energy-coupling factor transporter transmembrane protein EcfT
MQARGFRQSVSHSCYKSPAFGRPDICMLALLFALVLALLILSRLSP